MLNTSIGYHTFTMSVKLTYDQAKEILEDFKYYSKTTGGIKIHPVGEPKTKTLPNGNNNEIASDYRIEFLIKNKGVKWLIRFLNFSRVEMSMIGDSLLQKNIKRMDMNELLP